MAQGVRTQRKTLQPRKYNEENMQLWWRQARQGQGEEAISHWERGKQVQQGEEMPGDNTERTDEQQGQWERAPSFPSPREQCPKESHNKKAQEKRAGLSSHGKWSRCPRHIKRAVQRKLTAVVFQTTGKRGRAPLKIRTCPSASTGRKNSGKEGRVRQWDWDDSECVGLGEDRMWFRS